jgi:hypothetical protein
LRAYFVPCILSVVVTLLTAPVASAELRLGVYAQDITPQKFPVHVSGDFFDRTADRVVAPLHARTFVLDDGTTKLVMCVIDSCGVGREMLDEIKVLASAATGIPAERMMLSATHTHSAPSFGGLGAEPDPHYPAFFVKQVAAGIERAAKDLRPVHVGWTVVKNWEQTHCRQWVYRADRMFADPFGDVTVRVNMHPGWQNPNVIGPSGPVDPDLSLLAFRTPDGKPVALLANYSMHYYGADPISPDYMGLFSERAEALIAPGDEAFMAAMSQGTAGDMHWMEYGEPARNVGIERYTDDMLKLAHAAYQTIEYRPDATLAMAESLLELRVREPDEKRLAWAREVMKGVGDRAPKTHAEVYAREAIYLHEKPEQELKLQAIRIGDLGFAAIPNEVFALTGLKIKAQSPLEHTVNLYLANGAHGYIPPAELHPLGGYTTWPARSAGLEVGAEAKITDAVLGLLERVADKPRRPKVESHGAYAKAVLADKPVAYWRLNEWGGPDAADAAGNAARATQETGVLFYLEGPDSPAFSGPDTINRAPHFAGGRMAADLAGLGSTYSVEFWFWNGLASEARPVTGYLVSRGADGDPDAAGDHLGIAGTAAGADHGKLFFYNGNRHRASLIGRQAIAPRTWNHVLYVRDGTRVAAYLNGSPEPEFAGEAEVGHAPDVCQFFLAGRNDRLFGLEGRLDEVAIYDRALGGDVAAAHFRLAEVRPNP